MRIISWNVNGLRAARKKPGWLDMLTLKPDVLCLQETKMGGVDTPFLYEDWRWQVREDAEKKGYSGTMTVSGLSTPFYAEDSVAGIIAEEGRTSLSDFEDFILLNCYFPNGRRNSDRLRYKHNFYYAMLNTIEVLQSEVPVILCGDLNTAHQPIDLHDPAGNCRKSGFMDLERDWLTALAGLGMVDIWRHLNPQETKYTWWDPRTRARDRDLGWRIDHFWVDDRLVDRVEAAYIHDDIEGSDHCPISLELS